MRKRALEKWGKVTGFSLQPIRERRLHHEDIPKYLIISYRQSYKHYLE
jgi:hypothetical protein